VVCYNNLCPRRLEHKVTTINRDKNGAVKIALIGISTLVSKDGTSLPLFIRNTKKKPVSDG
jgi:hypothetical protein